VLFAKGNAGAGGKGDTMNMGDGATGTGENCWDFGANASCN